MNDKQCQKRIVSMLIACKNASELIIKLTMTGIDVNMLKQYLEDKSCLSDICDAILDDKDMWDIASLNTLAIDRSLFKTHVMKFKDLKRCKILSDAEIELFICMMFDEICKKQSYDHWLDTDRQFCIKTLGQLATEIEADEHYSEYCSKQHKENTANEISSSN